MGTIIEATATAIAHERVDGPGRAGGSPTPPLARAWTRAGRTADELDLLINAGVYHDKILSEPAFASLIQEDIGANLSQPARRRVTERSRSTSTTGPVAC